MAFHELPNMVHLLLDVDNPLSYWEISIRSLHCNRLAYNKLFMSELAGLQDVYVKFGAVDCLGCLLFVLVSVHGVKFQQCPYEHVKLCVFSVAFWLLCL